ncbi:hypothetical protein JJJ17_19585 [Paracoccus caeni]|uniref:VPEID-CTERM protein sorting domain-containing protein n=1 Tax=Paracoccus caeni TaxID=657651 RepID=A0A934SFW9_9RHOB|nr:hypothetical protein [Paracoccus caeni]MBK4218135.1 hypothetical protein [Paracoccus caeni]
MKYFTLAGLSTAAYGLFASVATAATCDINPTLPGCTPTTAIPEISALEGTAALAALAAIVLLTWERRRRAH